MLAGLRSSSQLACLLHNLSPESGRWIRRLLEWQSEYKSNAEREQIGGKNSVCLSGTVAHTSAPCCSTTRRDTRQVLSKAGRCIYLKPEIFSDKRVVCGLMQLGYSSILGLIADIVVILKSKAVSV